MNSSQNRKNIQHICSLAVLLALSLCFAAGSCDRSDLTDGPKLSSGETSGGGPGPGAGPGPGPGPGPGTGDCPPPPSVGQLKVKVNEVMTHNTSALADEHGNYPAWVEIYNNSDAEVNLGGVPLTDDLLQPSKWKIPCIPATKVAARGFLVIFLDGDTASENDLHASLLPAESGVLQLTVNKGSDIFTFDTSRLAENQSGGRSPDGGSTLAPLSAPTPGAANAEPAQPIEVKEGTFLRGDANSDGRVNVTDMTWILKTLFQANPLPACEDRFDANDDGAINLTDVLFIGRSLYQHGPAIPPPFVSAGKDPTVDSLPCPAP